MLALRRTQTPGVSYMSSCVSCVYKRGDILSHVMFGLFVVRNGLPYRLTEESVVRRNETPPGPDECADPALAADGV